MLYSKSFVSPYMVATSALLVSVGVGLFASGVPYGAFHPATTTAALKAVELERVLAAEANAALKAPTRERTSPAHQAVAGGPLTRRAGRSVRAPGNNGRRGASSRRAGQHHGPRRGLAVRLNGP